MALPFSNSMRALHSDHARYSQIGLIAAALLVTAWLAWFFLARLAVHETGQLLSLTTSGGVVATFPLKTARHIRRGQPATLYVQEDEPHKPFPAIVTHVEAQPEGKQLRVELYPQSRTGTLILTRHASQDEDQIVTGQASIEIAHTTPAALLMRPHDTFR